MLKLDPTKFKICWNKFIILKSKKQTRHRNQKKPPPHQNQKKSPLRRNQKKPPPHRNQKEASPRRWENTNVERVD